MRSSPHLLSALIAGALASACSTEPLPMVPPNDHLIVAIANVRGDLTPIARYGDGTWDRPPWAIPVEASNWKAVPTVDSLNWRWPDRHLTWSSSVRTWDSIGYPDDAVAVNVPEQWTLYSDSADASSLFTRDLRLIMQSGWCLAWTVQTLTDSLRREYYFDGSRVKGLALSRIPSAILPSHTVTDAELIAKEIGFPVPESNASWGPRYDWLGIFEFEGMTVGVLYQGEYGGRHAVVVFQGDAYEIVAQSEEC